jgi:hypothetical protein
VSQVTKLRAKYWYVDTLYNEQASNILAAPWHSQVKHARKDAIP